MRSLYLRVAARAWRHQIKLDYLRYHSNLLHYVRVRRHKELASRRFSYFLHKTHVHVGDNEANNPKARVFFGNAVDVLIEANYTKHLCIDLSSTHMLLNTEIVPCKRANHSSTRRTPWCWCHETLVAEWWRHKIFDILLSIAMHYGKTFSPPLSTRFVKLTPVPSWDIKANYYATVFGILLRNEKPSKQTTVLDKSSHPCGTFNEINININEMCKRCC